MKTTCVTSEVNSARSCEVNSARSCAVNSARSCAMECGWYLLRANIFHKNKTYRAGTLVEHLNGEWFLQDSLGHREEIPLSLDDVCRTHYEGVSLYEIECVGGEGFVVRPVLSTLSYSKVDPMVVQVPLRVGESRVCVRFGLCFLPLEFFNW